MNATPSLRARKQAATRERLYVEGFRLFARKGFDGTTVEEIAAAGGVSRRTFFRYFESKEALVFAKQPTRLSRFRELVVEHRAAGGFEAVVRACVALAPEFEAERDEIVLAQAIIDGSAVLTMSETARDLQWEQAITDALLASDSEPERIEAIYLAGAIIGLLRATLREWRRPDGPRDLGATAERNLRRLQRGFGA